MKPYRLIALALAVSLPLSAFAAEKKKIAQAERVVETSSNSSTSGTSEKNVTFSIGSVDGNFVFGPGFQMEWPLVLEGNHFAIGWQTGFYYSSTSRDLFGVQISSKTWGIPLLFSGKYLFNSSISFLKPFFAIATGLGIDRATVSRTVGGTEVKSSSTDLHFVFLFRPGLTFGETQTWFAELPMGVMFTEFAIMPTIGLHF